MLNKVVSSAKRAKRETEKWERAETCSGPAFSLPLLSPPRGLPLSSLSLSLRHFVPFPPPPLSLQGSLVSGYFAVKTTTPPSPAGTTPVIRPRLVSRQIRKGSHSPLYFISVLSPFSYRFFLGGPLSVRGFNFKGIGPRSGGKIQVGVLKLELSLFAPPRSLTIPSTNSLSFFSYSTYNPSDKTCLQGLYGFHHGNVYVKLFF